MEGAWTFNARKLASYPVAVQGLVLLLTHIHQMHIPFLQFLAVVVTISIVQVYMTDVMNRGPT